MEQQRLEWVVNDWAKPVYRPLQKPYGGCLSVQDQIEWRSQFIEGDPKPIASQDTVESMKKEGFIGLYREVK